MSGGRPRRVAEQDIPSCPRHGRNFRRKLDGTYGLVRKRQCYRCFPPDLASHSFVESLPRQLTPDESCPTCRERKQSGRRIFAILGAAHYVGGKMRIFRLRSVPTASSERHWVEFLHDIPDHGYPPRVVLADEGTGLPGALRQLWPQSSVQAACVYHLRAQLELILREIGLTTPARRDLFAGIQVALQPPQSNWDIWSASAMRLHAPRLTRWVTRKGAQIRRQIGWSYWPVSIGALELSLQRIKAMLDRRRFSYRNRKRLDRLLTLIALHLNEQDSEIHYSEMIRAHLLEHYGRPYNVRHAVYDHRGTVPSLRVA